MAEKFSSTSLSYLDNIKKHLEFIFALCSALAYTISDMIAYDLGGIFHPFLISAWLSFGMIIVCIASILLLRPTFPPTKTFNSAILVTLNAHLSVFSVLCVISANIYSNPGDATAISYVSTIFTAVLGVIVLRDPCRISDAIFVPLSFAGVFVIARPEFLFHNEELAHDNERTYLLGVILALCVAGAEACVLVLYSLIASHELHPLFLVLSSGLLGVTVNTLLYVSYLMFGDFHLLSSNTLS